MKYVLTIVLGVAAAGFLAANANAGNFSPVPSAKAGQSQAQSNCRQVCDSQVGGRCVSWRTVCSGNGGAVRG